MVYSSSRKCNMDTEEDVDDFRNNLTAANFVKA